MLEKRTYALFSNFVAFLMIGCFIFAVISYAQAQQGGGDGGAAALPSGSGSKESRPKTSLIELHEDNWQVMLKGEWMVEFFAPWCPACKNLASTWERFAAASMDIHVNVAKIDVTTSPSLSGRFFVTALPTIYHVKDGEFRQYRGSRDGDALMFFVKQKQWQKIDPISAWKKPDTIHMSILSYFFKLSHTLKLPKPNTESLLLEECFLPQDVTSIGWYKVDYLAAIQTKRTKSLMLEKCFLPQDVISIGWYKEKLNNVHKCSDKSVNKCVLEVSKKLIISMNMELTNAGMTSARKRKRSNHNVPTGHHPLFINGLLRPAASVHITSDFNSRLQEEYGLPTWGSYALFAIGTIFVGAALGLLLVCIVDFLYPPKKSQRQSFSESKEKSYNAVEDIANDEIEDDAVEELEKDEDDDENNDDEEEDEEHDDDENEHEENEAVDEESENDSTSDYINSKTESDEPESDKNASVKNKSEENKPQQKSSPSEVRKRKPRKAD